MSSLSIQMFQMLSATPSRGVERISKTQANPSLYQNSSNKTSEPSAFGQAFEVELSAEARLLSSVQSKEAVGKVEPVSKIKSKDEEIELSEEEKQEVEKLKARDAEVKRHEQAHLAAAGAYAKGGPSFEYDSGPDNKKYAVSGEVQIDTSKESTPEKTLSKAQVILKASLAPEAPSSTDKKVASQAQKMAVEARQELGNENSLGEVSDSQELNNDVNRDEPEKATEVQKQSIYQYQKPSSPLGQSLNFVA